MEELRAIKVQLNLVIMGFLVLLAAGAWAQPGGGMHYGMMWDANSVTTLTGEVTGVEKYTPGRGGSAYGLKLTVKTGQETVPVILGPGWYVEQQHFAFAPKDRLELKGSRLTIQGQPTMVAAEVKKGDKVLKLRDDLGLPLWAGPR